MTNSPNFSELLGRIKKGDDDQYHLTITENWMQGRTSYGGLTAAICLQAVYLEHPALPPLRTAQISFIGPAAGDISISVKVMRQGRSVSYISAEMQSTKGIATYAVFCFGEARKSRLNRNFTEKPNVPSAEQSPPFYSDQFAPTFTDNYNSKLASGGHLLSGSDKHEHYIWVQHKDKQANDIVALVGIADMPPPAVMPMFDELAPLSSIAWTINFLSDDVSSEDGWWLIRSAAEHARDGYSSQDMQVWNSDGDLVISAMQEVALFY